MAETNGLLNRRTGKSGTEGSNPSVSATLILVIPVKRGWERVPVFRAALQERDLPILVGQISKISADSLKDERSGIAISRSSWSCRPANSRSSRCVREDGALRAGLPVDIMIPLRKRTALSYLIEPITQAL